MAQIKFNPNQPIQSLSGTVGAVSFRTRNGRTFMYRTGEPVLPKNPTRKQRAQYKQRIVVDFCVSAIQAQIPDIQDALAMRPTIRSRVMRLYKLLSPSTKARTKLQGYILAEYGRRFCKSEPIHSR